MRFLWDTNILLHYIRQSNQFDHLSTRYNFFSGDNKVFLSIISVAEIQSLAYQLNWGAKRRNQLQFFLEKISLLGVYDEMVDVYAKIDAFSQGRLFDSPLPIGLTSRNMGKNDLWLAATASVFDLNFVTMDNDFDHLHQVFIEVIKK